MARAAPPIHESWAGNADVRVSDLVGVPVTFGSTVLLPAEYVDWSEAKRQAVLSHEGSHVAHGDFYVLLLATINRAVFWFNPLAWWQLVRLTELAEIISDDAALEMLDDRSSYAHILRGRGQRPAGARRHRHGTRRTVRRRIERILAGAAAPARMDWRKRALIAAVLAPLVAISAGSIAFGVPPSRSNPVALNTQQPDSLAAHQFDRYVGHYAADPSILPNLVLTVTREGDHLFVQRTGQPSSRCFQKVMGPSSTAWSTSASRSGRMEQEWCSTGMAWISRRRESTPRLQAGRPGCSTNASPSRRGCERRSRSIPGCSIAMSAITSCTPGPSSPSHARATSCLRSSPADPSGGC
jgi:hypothetical protein